jgi:hypothetical protein
MKQNLTDEQLERHLSKYVQYQILSDAQRKFVKAFIQNKGDRSALGMQTKQTYNYTKIPAVVDVLRKFGYFNLRKPVVGKKELVRLISSRLRDDSISTSEFIRLAEMHEALKPVSAKKKSPATIDEAVLAAERKL